MQRGCEGLAARLEVVLVLSVCVVLGAGEVTAAPVIHSCTFDAPGEGCIFDLVGSGGGGLKVDTKAGTAGDRWRTTIVMVDTKTVESNVGTGSATSFTGLVQRTVANGKGYEVAVAYEFPLSGTLPDPFPPASVAVRFSGPAVDQDHVTIAGPRPSGPGAPAGPPAPVAQTGLTGCWDVYGNPINCAGTGQDGEIQAGVPSPTPRFTDHGNGTVTDNLTGLIWLKDASCLGVHAWTDALTAVASLNAGTDFSCANYSAGTFGDWHLPNVKELQSLIHFGFFGPALSNAAGTAQWREDDAFVDVRTHYWSSTTWAPAVNPDFAWLVYLHDGGPGPDYKDLTYLVWPVRGGP